MVGMRVVTLEEGRAGVRVRVLVVVVAGRRPARGDL